MRFHLQRGSATWTQNIAIYQGSSVISQIYNMKRKFRLSFLFFFFHTHQPEGEIKSPRCDHFVPDSVLHRTVLMTNFSVHVTNIRNTICCLNRALNGVAISSALNILCVNIMDDEMCFSAVVKWIGYNTNSGDLNNLCHHSVAVTQEGNYQYKRYLKLAADNEAQGYVNKFVYYVTHTINNKLEMSESASLPEAISSLTLETFCG